LGTTAKLFTIDLKNMRTHTKPLVALASGITACSALLCQTVQAQSIVLGTQETSYLANANGVDTGSSALPITWDVTESDNVYTYSYTIANPSADPSLVESFSVGFNANLTGAVVGTPGGGGVLNGTLGNYIGVIWSPLFISAGDSATVTFESDEAPVFGNANANGSTPNGPWASSPSGQTVPVPSPVPEPAATSLLALSLLLVPFRGAIFKKS
jgi:hypothetical protein